MTLEGVVKNGTVVLEHPLNVPDGTRVQIVLPVEMQLESSPAGEPISDLAKMLLRHAGTLSDLPEDAAAQHDHYLYGTPKR